MPWIREAEIEQGKPAPAAIISVMSINPKAMDAVQNFGQSVTFGSSSLTRIQEEAIATAVSVANSCRY